MGNVTFLGVEGSGKTVLTMALLKCFKAHEHEGWFLRPESNGAFRFLNRLPKELAVGAFPNQTVESRHLALSVVKDSMPQRTFDILDYPGEVFRLAFLDATSDADPEGFRARVATNREDIEALLGHLMGSDQVFVLFNLDDSRDLASNLRNSDAVWVTNACIDYLRKLPNRPGVTLLLTQIDRYVDLSTHDFNPGAYVAHHLPLIAQNFPDLDILAVSAIGPTEATYGLDAILLRCLFGIPYVRGSLDTLRDTKAAISTLFPRAFRERSSEVYNALLSAARRYNAAIAKMESVWFCPLENLTHLRETFTSEALMDIVILLRFAREAADIEGRLRFSARRNALYALKGELSGEAMVSIEGDMWKQFAMEALTYAAKK